ncbi:MAG: SCO1664 family protein [Acidimicrobiales bacterium]
MADLPSSPPEGPSGDEPSGAAFGLPVDELETLLQDGEIAIEGRMPYSSNATFLVEVTDGRGRAHRAIYKPGRGERPLWDFPPDLYRREVAAYRLARALGWSVVPPTVIASGPAGEGSLQAFVDADFSEHYFTLLDQGVGLDDLRRLCALDLIANNTDRKSGHCLLGHDGRIYGIDHGLAFHAQDKLRTVMWDFAGDPVPADIVDDVTRFLDLGPPLELCRLLNADENDALLRRARRLVDRRTYPDDDTGGHRYPWPLV